MGQPHPSGRAALRMLEHEGFVFDRYIDIFDGGPTVTAATDQIRTIRECARRDGRRDRPTAAARRCSSRPAGSRTSGPAARRSRSSPKKGIRIDPEAAELLEVEVGDQVAWSRADAAERDQFRRHRRPEPQLCRASASAISPRRATRARSRSRAPPRSRASTRCAPTSRSASTQGMFLPHPRPDRAWLAELGDDDRGGRAGARPPTRCRPRRCGRPMPRPSRPRPTLPTAAAT